MKVLHTVIAMVILLALGGVFYYLRQQPVPEPEGTIPKKKLFAFAPNDVEEFSIKVAGQPKAAFRRLSAKAGQAGEQAGPYASEYWEILSPAGIAADHLAIRDFVNDLPKMEYTPLGEGGATPPSPADYGLDQPQKIFQFKLKQGAVRTFSIGGENPSGYARYGMLDSEPGIFLLDTVSTPALEKTLFDLRDKRLLPIVMDNAQRLELRFRSPTTPSSPRQIVLAKAPNGNWELAQPKVRTDYGSTNYFISTLSGAVMKTVEEEMATSLARYGLDQPSIRLDVTTEGRTLSLQVGNKKELTGEITYYAKNSEWPQVFTIAESVYNQLNSDLDTYRNRSLFDFGSSSEVRRLEVLGPQGELRLEKKGDAWDSLAASQTAINSSAVDIFLVGIQVLRAEQFISDQPGRLAEYGLDRPWMKIKVTFGQDNREETMLLSLHNKRFYAARQGEPSVYELSLQEQEALETKLKEITG
ncbi:MAG: DUF4340 domain-containing protein [Acidobacteria bacterium]|nr:DUF4340 domain-containing protein [Acidobacteriota bacterium]